MGAARSWWSLKKCNYTLKETWKQTGSSSQNYWKFSDFFVPIHQYIQLFEAERFIFIWNNWMFLLFKHSFILFNNIQRCVNMHHDMPIMRWNIHWTWFHFCLFIFLKKKNNNKESDTKLRYTNVGCWWVECTDGRIHLHFA